MSVLNPKPWPFKGSVWTVSADGYADFTTIQSAIDDASVVAGDTILIGPGDYPEKLLVTKRLNFVGTGIVEPAFIAGVSVPGVTLNPTLAAGEFGIDFSLASGSTFTGINVSPITISGIAGSATGVRAVLGCEFRNCRFYLRSGGGGPTVGPFISFHMASASGFVQLYDCSFAIDAFGAGAILALYSNQGVATALRLHGCRFMGANAECQVNTPNGSFYAFGCEFDGNLSNVASTNFYVSPDTVVGGVRTTAGDPSIAAATPNGLIWYDTATSKLRGREGGVSKDIIPAASGASLTRIAGSSGAAGADFTTQRLTANSADVTTVALSASVMTTTGVGVGVWKFKYTLLYQAAATGTGIAFGVNHTGTVTKFRAHWTHVTTGGAAATGVGDNDTTTVAGQLVEGKADAGLNAILGSASAGVAAANTDIMAILEGILVVSVPGNLELKIATEVAGSAVRITADSMLELVKL